MDNYLVVKGAERKSDGSPIGLPPYQLIAGSKNDLCCDSIKFSIYPGPTIVGVNERLGSSSLFPFYWPVSQWCQVDK